MSLQPPLYFRKSRSPPPILEKSLIGGHYIWRLGPKRHIITALADSNLAVWYGITIIIYMHTVEILADFSLAV